MKQLLNKDWIFHKGCASLENAVSGEKINLPHTWNNLDGQDGGSDYFRGACFYTKNLTVEKREDKDYYLEFRGVNSIADVFVNGEKVCHHEGGFSTFRAKITEQLKNGENAIAVQADNSANDRVYPQMADFTFFGGIYRDVYFIEANKCRFDLDYLGSEGVLITPILEDKVAKVNVKAFITSPIDSAKVVCKVLFEGKEIAVKEEKASEVVSFDYVLENPTLWDSIENPALYQCEVKIEDEQVLDERTVNFGVRSFKVDKDGFILNGRRYPLHGVSRHQDRQDMGWAITQKEHAEDMELIKEVGANTIRLAHYQHDQFFYDLCDKNGMVVWAEIPYISSHLANGGENAVSQMKELVIQNYNHPSIFCWGLSNEITITGETPDLLNLHKTLNDLCHSLDSTRPTTMAHVTMLDTDSPMTKISDIFSYNHYFGWYVGDVNGNAEWLDDFRAKYPETPIGLSEYGCEAILKWHNSNPKQGDYSEEYQSYYHENMLKIFAERPYLWATHVWNMFDFGVDGRDEGGVAGRNNKGLVTYDRKTKKDSFYIYKAHWTKEPFVHIASKRYVFRAEKITKVKVYSNCDSVTLFVNGKKFERKTGKYSFEFDVKLKRFGYTNIKAVCGNLTDESKIKYVRKPYADYCLKGNKPQVENWFDKEGKYDFKFPEGYLSIKDKLNVIMATEEGHAFVTRMIDTVISKMMSKEGEGQVKLSPSMLKLVGGMTIERIAAMAGDKISTEMLFEANEALNKIKKA